MAGEQALRDTLEKQAAANARLLGEVQEQRRLLENLSRIQRSISHRAPLQEVLDTVTYGAKELLGDDIAGLRLVDPESPDHCILVSVYGVSDAIKEKLRRGPLHEGAGGRAILEDRLVIISDYDVSPNAIQALAEDRLHVAMAAPVHEHGHPVGSLVVASYDPDRSYTRHEQDALVALAEHASLALNDAKAVEEMREAQRAKDLFFAMASHELKTPLTVMIGALRTLQMHDADLKGDVRADLLGSACQRGMELRELIDRMLQGARAELAGVSEEVALADLVTHAVSGFDHSRKIVISPLPTEVIATDRGSIHEILGTLLENALAHSPAGTEISVDAEIDHDEAVISVRNHGVLPTDLDVKSLFLPFSQGSGSSGVGLGLYIAARLTSARGGSIDVSQSDGIVCFQLRFPLHRVAEPPGVVDQTDASPRIVVVES